MGLCPGFEVVPLPMLVAIALLALFDLLDTGEHMVVPRYPGAFEASTCGGTLSINFDDDEPDVFTETPPPATVAKFIPF